MDEQLWTVADSSGVEHGTFDRRMAYEVMEKVSAENRALEWVSMRHAELEAPLPVPNSMFKEVEDADVD